MCFIFFFHFPYSRLFILFTFGSFFTVLLLNRVLFNILVISLKVRFKFSKNVVVIGYNEQSKRLINYFKNESKLVKVSGCFDDQYRNIHQETIPFMGGLRECLPFVMKNNVSEIYSTLAPEKNPFLYELSKEAEKNFVHFKFVPDFNNYVKGNVHVEYVDNIPVLSQRIEPLDNTGNRILKRLLDITLSLFVIIFILSWLLPILALLIKLDSRGPVFFIQPRSGKKEEEFLCIKLRTLRVNDEAHTRQVTSNDKRITRVGKFLRKTSLDELPQFINVLLGEMSVVGPRPHMIKHTEEFSEHYKEYFVRHFVKPGITGWAQVHNLRGEITNVELLHKRTEYDLWYLENWTLWLDIKIILLTIWVSLVNNENAV
jgi:putative colanic acid biosynthesis UDP-glucose lipid carrier transferase